MVCLVCGFFWFDDDLTSARCATTVNSLHSKKSITFFPNYNICPIALEKFINESLYLLLYVLLITNKRTGQTKVYRMHGLILLNSILELPDTHVAILFLYFFIVKPPQK